MHQPFDVGRFWGALAGWLDFVKSRIEYGQTDVEGTKMDDYINTIFADLEKSIADEVDAKSGGKKLLFWADCQEALGSIYDLNARKPLGSISFSVVYQTLIKMQRLVSAKPSEHWISRKRGAMFSEELPVSKRTKSIPGVEWTCNNWKCKALNNPKSDYCKKCWKAKPIRKHDTQMGQNGIWLWKDPPKVLHEGAGFWIFFKNAYWVCDTPEDVNMLKQFTPSVNHVNGNFTSWVNEKYAKQYPFLNKYDKPKGINYGLLNRLDRETSGPVVVAKDEQTFWKLKSNRDGKSWFKEYVCLVHGRVPVEESQGVLENYMLTDSKGSSGYTKVVDDWHYGATKAISFYQVRSYHMRNIGSEIKRYTLMRVRIITGRRHQIRVHMNHFLKSLGARIGESEDFGLVSDFLYLKPETSKEDKETLCDRVFLHARLLGMWDPEDHNKLIYVKAVLPKDLRETLAKLDEDEEAIESLKKHTENIKRYPGHAGLVESFCQNYGLDARERQELLEGWFWKYRKDLCSSLIEAFSERAGDGLDTLSVDGDHSFLLEGIRKDLECEGNVQKHNFDNWLEQSLQKRIDNVLWFQQVNQLQHDTEQRSSDEALPEGWRRMEAKGMVYYVHEGGLMSRIPPLDDPQVPKGWSKFESTEHGSVYYTDHLQHRTTWTFPGADDLLPPGWEKMRSRTNPELFYYLHAATGRSQRGLPCEGSLDDLPPGWEKCASRKTRLPFYFHPSSNTNQIEKPLPPGWRRSSGGYSHSDGCGTTTMPIYDRRVPAGWTKLESRSKPGQFYYVSNKDATKTQLTLPSQ